MTFEFNLVTNGKSLFVGEGNLSFVLSLATKLKYSYDIAASTFENYNELSEFGKNNTKILYY